MVMIRRRLLIEGRVQGVGYRISCAREVARLGLAGRVRNLVDGRVEVVVEGPSAEVEQLVAWCWQGPPLARVRSVDIADEEPEGAAGVYID